MQAPAHDDQLPHLLEKIYRDSALDFRGYRKTSLRRRIARRLRAHRIHSYSEYAAILDADPNEYQRLLDDLSINVSDFFRDREAFRVIDTCVLPELIRRKQAERRLKIWSAGCASGEEPYSIGIMLNRHLGDRIADWDIRIYATDLHEGTLDKARLGVYDHAKLESLGEDVKRYFSMDGRCRITDRIRGLVRFGCHNLTSDPVISRVDLLLCRNVLIYFDRPLQKKVCLNLHWAISEGGFLFLGEAESLSIPIEGRFEVIDKRWKIYRKTGTTEKTRHKGTEAQRNRGDHGG